MNIIIQINNECSYLHVNGAAGVGKGLFSLGRTLYIFSRFRNVISQGNTIEKSHFEENIFKHNTDYYSLFVMFIILFGLL